MFTKYIPYFAIIVMHLFLYLGDSTPISAQETSDSLDIRKTIMPLSKDGIFRDADYFNWGACIIKGEDGKYHLFYSRWKRSHTFSGWLTHSEIAHAVSEKATGPWAYYETVLKGRRDGHWDDITAHNPKIKYFEGNYYLYYIATNLGRTDYTEEDLIDTHGKSLSDSTRRKLRENQRTGVATSKSLFGPWTRLGQPLVEPTYPIATLTVNPAIERGPNEIYYMIIKGDKPNEANFVRNQAVATSRSPVGPFTIKPKPVIDDLDTEDVSLWYQENVDRFYAVFHAHTYIGLMTSTDGINWERAKNYEIMDKRIRMDDGSDLHPDRMERPYIFIEDGEPKVLSLAVKKGDDSFTIFVPLGPAGK